MQLDSHHTSVPSYLSPGNSDLREGRECLFDAGWREVETLWRIRLHWPDRSSFLGRS